MRSLLFTLALVAATSALASPVTSIGGNTQSTAQAISPSDFSLNEIPTIYYSTTIPHVEIISTGRSVAGFDWYRFDVNEQDWIQTQLDIDYLPDSGNHYDYEIGIFNSAGRLIDSNDDLSYDPGSVGYDPGLFYLHLDPGTYYVAVCRYPCGFDWFWGNFGVYGAALPTDAAYILNISEPSVAQVSEPGTLALLLLGIGGLATSRRRRS